MKLWKSIDDQMDVAIDETNPRGQHSKKSVAESQKYIEYLGKVPLDRRPGRASAAADAAALAIAVIGGDIVTRS